MQTTFADIFYGPPILQELKLETMNCVHKWMHELEEKNKSNHILQFATKVSNTWKHG